MKIITRRDPVILCSEDHRIDSAVKTWYQISP